MDNLQTKTEKLLKYGNAKFGLNESTLRDVIDNAQSELVANNDAEMTGLLTSQNIGKVVKFAGTSDIYETGAYYLIGE